MMKSSFAIATALVAVLSSCTTPQYKPLEYSVPATRETAHSALVEGFSALGYRIYADTEFSLTLDQQQTAGEAIFINRRYSYQIAIVGSSPTKILPRILMTQGNALRPLTIDVTDRAEVKAKLQQQIEPIIRQLGGKA